MYLKLKLLKLKLELLKFDPLLLQALLPLLLLRLLLLLLKLMSKLGQLLRHLLVRLRRHYSHPCQSSAGADVA